MLAFVSHVIAAPRYNDAATSEWFSSLKMPGSGTSCCDQADCHRAASEQRGGEWWALSERGFWIQIPPEKVLRQMSIFEEAVLCERPESQDKEPHVYCFTPPPSFSELRLPVEPDSAHNPVLVRLPGSTRVAVRTKAVAAAATL